VVGLREFGGALFNTGDKTLRATSTIGKVREALTIRSGGYLELKDLARQFAIIDTDKSGTLSKEELKIGLAKFLRVFNLELSRAEFEKIFAAFDKDGDGTLSYNEFIRGVRGDMNDRREALVKLVSSFAVKKKEEKEVLITPFSLARPLRSWTRTSQARSRPMKSSASTM